MPSSRKGCSKRKGSGILNKIIDKLPVEFHIPSYRYCGPGTKLEKRLARGDKPKNKLDAACLNHDIAYSKSSSLEKRHEADKQLGEAAWHRFKSEDAGIGEKAAALFVTSAMKTKRTLGMGMLRKSTKQRKGKKQRKKSKKTLSFAGTVRKARAALKNAPNIVDMASAVKTARNAIRGVKIKAPTRIITVPKSGGFLPLIPIFAGLSALGTLTGGIAGIAKAINEYKNGREQLAESNRHNQTMEAIAIGKGLYLRPYNNGMGLQISKN